MSVRSGPPVTVTRKAQPCAGLLVTSSPHTPFQTKAGSHREIIITMHVTECGKVPENAGLSFLDVTLRNAHAIQVHRFIAGARPARDPSEALQDTYGNDSM